MSNLIAIGTGVALAAILVAAVSVRRDEAQPSKPVTFEARLEQDMPVLPKADRLFVLVEPPYQAPPEQTRNVLPAAPPPVTVKLAPLTARDPVCGPRGRTYYTKNGWKYWRCNR